MCGVCASDRARVQRRSRYERYRSCLCRGAKPPPKPIPHPLPARAPSADLFLHDKQRDSPQTSPTPVLQVSGLPIRRATKERAGAVKRVNRWRGSFPTQHHQQHHLQLPFRLQPAPPLAATPPPGNAGSKSRPAQSRPRHGRRALRLHRTSWRRWQHHPLFGSLIVPLPAAAPPAHASLAVAPTRRQRSPLPPERGQRRSRAPRIPSDPIGAVPTRRSALVTQLGP